MKVKFHANYMADHIGFLRNSVWDYYDKREVYQGIREDDYPGFVWVYRIMFEDELVDVPANYVIEVIQKGNDYTEQEWRDKITTDALVEDGDYVKAWEETFSINKPVKDSVEQTDYSSDWNRVLKQIEERYGKEDRTG